MMQGAENAKKRNGKSHLFSWRYYSPGDKAFTAIVYFVITLIALICVYPLYFTVIASVSDAHAVYTGKVNFVPIGFTMKAYEMVFETPIIWQGYRNSVFYTCAGTVFNLILTIPAAYALGKKRMFCRGILTAVFLITMYFGGGMIPTYILMKNLKLINTPWIMILSGGVSVYNVVVTRTYFQNNIPEEMYEAARIDGAGEFKIFFRMVLPLSKPIIAVIALYYAVAHWSGYFNALIYLTDNSLQPLQIILRRILILNEQSYMDAVASDAGAAYLADAAQRAYMAKTMQFAVVFIGSAPMLILYPFIQKFFVKGVMIGSLKG